ncbi:AIR synthase related protein [Leekyejoonella antrihumi]|uniref:Sll0787 family AIR synthase-like protein n=1 Tax=Leekyejoonella antrihumi TaxID=1660198 RepID=A0A563E6H6_9MICO|nr:AIR synthase related protein [Leekyejoonella antrihumi]TWP38035.1 hypothetical protein FGL98_04845 [Leekyejoonella antrihumi]
MAESRGSAGLATLAGALRRNPALTAKQEIALVGDVFGGGDWITGPGDDGAVVTMDPDPAGADVVACGEALLPAFITADPYGAGLAAILTNVNDLAAMGAVPKGIVDTVVGSEPVAREILRGLRAGSEMYRVPLVGGHLTLHDGAAALSAFGLGQTRRALSSTRAAPGQTLLLACCTAGRMRPDFPFFASFDERGDRLGDDVRTLASVAESGACVAAKDVSMAGLIGSLAMLLEHRRLGVTVDLDALPVPAGVPLDAWLMCFPAFAFLLCAPSDRAGECAAAFTDRGLEATVLGHLDASGVLAIQRDGDVATVMDLRVDTVTGLRH